MTSIAEGEKNAEFHITHNVRVFSPPLPMPALINSQLYRVQNKYTGGTLIKLPGLLRFNLLLSYCYQHLTAGRGTAQLDKRNNTQNEYYWF